jgi:hypothetical protein
MRTWVSVATTKRQVSRVTFKDGLHDGNAIGRAFIDEPQKKDAGVRQTVAKN